MQTWEKIVVLACILVLVFSLCFSIVSASPVDDLNLTETQKEGVCNALNMSMFECVGLWVVLDNYEIEECNYSGLVNESDYDGWVNSSNVTSCDDENVTDDSVASDIMEQMTLIQGMENVGLSPVFSGLDIVNWTRTDAIVSECSLDEYVLLELCEEQKMDIYNDCNASVKPEEKGRVNLWWFALALVPLYLFRNKIEKAVKKKINTPMDGGSGYSHSPTSHPSEIMQNKPAWSEATNPHNQQVNNINPSIGKSGKISDLPDGRPPVVQVNGDSKSPSPAPVKPAEAWK